MKVDGDEKQRVSKSSNRIAGASEFLGHAPSATVASESGLYRLIMRADSAKSKPFRDWVVREVLPSIRRTGGYLLNENARETAHADTKEAMPLPAGN